MTFTESIATCFSKYATFSGRATQPEYWWFALFTWVVSISLSVAGAASGSGLSNLSLIFGLATFLPGLSAAIRRLHDTDHSGWFLLIALVPFGGFYVLWLLIMKSTDGPNTYDYEPGYPQAGTRDQDWAPPEDTQFR